MVPITITQPLTLTHWNIAAPQKVIGPRAVRPRPALAARTSRSPRRGKSR